MRVWDGDRGGVVCGGDNQSSARSSIVVTRGIVIAALLWSWVGGERLRMVWERQASGVAESMEVGEMH